MQCQALQQEGANVTLYAKRTVPEESELQEVLAKHYGLQSPFFSLQSHFSKFNKADNLRIAVMAALRIGLKSPSDSILSRNLYASFWFAVILRQPILFETHQLEQGFKRHMQRMIATRPWVKTIVISDALRTILTEHIGTSPAHTLVLHDAAPDGLTPSDPTKRRTSLIEFVPEAVGDWATICGYFGHLYRGRGIEIIEELARERPRVLFVIFGGSETDVKERKDKNRGVDNLLFIGHVPHPVAQVMMRSVDVLLMPYQASVSIGVSGHDTARWMSPMKMFEYMAAAVPIIASDLPVLGEVLESGRNAILANPSNPEAWAEALDRIREDASLASRIGENAYQDYVMKYTWRSRARAMLAAVRTA